MSHGWACVWVNAIHLNWTFFPYSELVVMWSRHTASFISKRTQTLTTSSFYSPSPPTPTSASAPGLEDDSHASNHQHHHEGQLLSQLWWAHRVFIQNERLFDIVIHWHSKSSPPQRIIKSIKIFILRLTQKDYYPPLSLILDLRKFTLKLLEL